MNELDQPSAWAVALQIIYASMNNQDLSTDYNLNELLNVQLVIIHTRPLSTRWSVIGMLGGDVAINNVLGYPMAFFALYLDWHKNRKYEFNLSMASKFQISAGMKLNEKLKLRLVGEANGMSAVVEKDGDSKIFVRNYSTIRLQPELKLEILLTVQMSAGISVIRDVYFQDRIIKAFYADVEDYPHFGIAPYVSVGLKYGF